MFILVWKHEGFWLIDWWVVGIVLICLYLCMFSWMNMVVQSWSTLELLILSDEWWLWCGHLGILDANKFEFSIGAKVVDCWRKFNWIWIYAARLYRCGVNCDVSLKSYGLSLAMLLVCRMVLLLSLSLSVYLGLWVYGLILFEVELQLWSG